MLDHHGDDQGEQGEATEDDDRPLLVVPVVLLVPLGLDHVVPGEAGLHTGHLWLALPGHGGQLGAGRGRPNHGHGLATACHQPHGRHAHRVVRLGLQTRYPQTRVRTSFVS